MEGDRPPEALVVAVLLLRPSSGLLVESIFGRGARSAHRSPAASLCRILVGKSSAQKARRSRAIL